MTDEHSEETPYVMEEGRQPKVIPGTAWGVLDEHENPAEDHVGIFVIQHVGPGRPTLAGMTDAINAKLKELGVHPRYFKCATAIVSNQKVREVYYYNGSGGDGD